MLCPLCQTPKTSPFWEDKKRVYRRCETCLLVFVPAAYHLCPVAEKAEYDRHCNHPADLGYRRFLSRLSAPLCEKLPAGARGLDFGSGPGPTLAPMLTEAGFPTTLYDPFYAPDPAVLGKRYDFVTCSEVVEHFRQPDQEFSRLWQLLADVGWLGIMTKLVIDRQAFARWHYKNDPTHIIFFSRQTFLFLADHLGARIEFVEPDVVLLQKGIREDPTAS